MQSQHTIHLDTLVSRILMTENKTMNSHSDSSRQGCISLQRKAEWKSRLSHLNVVGFGFIVGFHRDRIQGSLKRHS